MLKKFMFNILIMLYGITFYIYTYTYNLSDDESRILYGWRSVENWFGCFICVLKYLLSLIAGWFE